MNGSLHQVGKETKDLLHAIYVFLGEPSYISQTLSAVCVYLWSQLRKIIKQHRERDKKIDSLLEKTIVEEKDFNNNVSSINKRIDDIIAYTTKK